MASGGGNGADFYAVLGLKKDCSAVELRNAYKKLALRWHPDRCSASGNVKFVEEAKKKFQAIQEAYSVLSDANKRFLYDVGVYDSDDEETGMGDFMEEMVMMMNQNEPSGNAEESFEELQEMFQEMLQRDDRPTKEFGSSSACSGTGDRFHPSSSSRSRSGWSGKNRGAGSCSGDMD